MWKSPYFATTLAGRKVREMRTGSLLAALGALVAASAHAGLVLALLLAPLVLVMSAVIFAAAFAGPKRRQAPQDTLRIILNRSDRSRSTARSASASSATTAPPKD